MTRVEQGAPGCPFPRTFLMRPRMEKLLGIEPHAAPSYTRRRLRERAERQPQTPCQHLPESTLLQVEAGQAADRGVTAGWASPSAHVRRSRFWLNFAPLARFQACEFEHGAFARVISRTYTGGLDAMHSWVLWPALRDSDLPELRRRRAVSGASCTTRSSSTWRGRSGSRCADRDAPGHEHRDRSALRLLHELGVGSARGPWAATPQGRRPSLQAAVTRGGAAIGRSPLSARRESSGASSARGGRS